MGTVDCPPGYQPEYICPQVICCIAVGVEYPVKYPAPALDRLGTNCHNIVSIHCRLIGVPDDRLRIRHIRTVKLIYIIANSYIQSRIHALLMGLLERHINNSQRLRNSRCPFPQFGERVILTACVDHNDLILHEMSIQNSMQRVKERHSFFIIIFDVDNRRDEIPFFTHKPSTSSKSYTVLIFPESTLINVGSLAYCRTTVGLESSISLAFKIGFILNKLLTY